MIQLIMHSMVQRAVHNYYKLLDETLESSTFLVLIISALICLVWFLSPTAHAEPDFSAAPENIIMIDGVEYQLEIQRLTK